MVSFDDIEEELENPGAISDPERKQLMEKADRHYNAACKATDQHIVDYELEAAERALERYEWEKGVMRP